MFKMFKKWFGNNKRVKQSSNGASRRRDYLPSYYSFTLLDMPEKEPFLELHKLTGGSLGKLRQNIQNKNPIFEIDKEEYNDCCRPFESC